MRELQSVSETQTIVRPTASEAQSGMQPFVSAEGQGITDNTHEGARDIPYHDYMRRAAQEGYGAGRSAIIVYYYGGHLKRSAADASLGTSTSIL